MDAASAHRNNERVRHRRLHHLLDSAANHVPKLPDRKETKVHKLRRVILYLAHLTKLKKKYAISSKTSEMKIIEKKCEKTSTLKEVPYRKHTKANIVFLGNKLEHLKKNQLITDEPAAQVQKSKFVNNAFLDNYKVQNYHSEGYSLWELKEDGMPLNLNHKICLETSVTDQVKSMQSLATASCSARKTKKPTKGEVCKSFRTTCFGKPRKNPKDTHILHQNTDSFNHLQLNSVNHIPSAYFKSIFKPFDYTNEFSSEATLNSEEFNCNDSRYVFPKEALPESKSAYRAENAQCSTHVNVGDEYWRKNIWEGNASPERIECQNATRYLMKNLSSGSSESYEDGFDGFMENFSDFNGTTFKFGPADNKQGLENISSCDEDSFAENAKILHTSELSPTSTYLYSDDSFRKKPEYFFPTQQNEMSFVDASDTKNNYDLFVPQSDSVLGTENDDNWLFLHPIKQEPSMDCQRKSYEPINLEPYLPLTEVSTSFNFMNSLEF